MTVIAMTRELGTLGNEVAAGLAREQGLRLVTHETVERLARKTPLHASAVLRCIEGKPTLLERWRADLAGLAILYLRMNSSITPSCTASCSLSLVSS